MSTREMLLLLTLALAAPVQADTALVTSLQTQYRVQGAGDFSAARGEKLWTQEVPGKDGKLRSCPACHGQDLTRNGQHATTRKAIKPLSTKTNPKRFTDEKKVSKWLVRNCKWTFGHDCTPQEKGDLLEYLTTH